MLISCDLWEKVSKLISIGPMFIWNTRVTWLRQYKLFPVILFWKLRLDPPFVRYSLDRESELFCTLWIPFCTIFLWPQWSWRSIRLLIDMQASRSYEYSNKWRLKLRFQLFSPHYRSSFYLYLNIPMTARAKLAINNTFYSSRGLDRFSIVLSTISE